MPSHRYRDVFERVRVPLTAAERAWPERRITAAPLWVPVDLRDGNQALAEPMDTPRQRRMFDLFVALGYREIEVAYPSAGRPRTSGPCSRPPTWPRPPPTRCPSKIRMLRCWTGR